MVKTKSGVLLGETEFIGNVEMTNFIPSFNSCEWVYQSFLIAPAGDENPTDPGTAVQARKWAMGQLVISDGPEPGSGSGILTFAPGVQLEVEIESTSGIDGQPAKFEAMGRGIQEPTKGSEYQLTGWAFAVDGELGFVRGAIRSVRGSNSNPDFELGGMPVGTVGLFQIEKAS